MEVEEEEPATNSNPSPKTYRDALSKGRSDPTTSVVDSPLTSEQEAALQLRFPSRVLLSREKVAAASAFWLNAVIAKPLGRDVSPEVMESSLTPQWSTLGEWELFPMAYGLFLVRFASPESRDAVLLGGPWVVSGAALAVSPFIPDFRPHPSHVTRAVIWVRLPDLPPSVWSAELISDILGVAGRVVRLDEDTEHRRRGRFARAAVEVDLTQPLPPGVTVDVEGGSPPSFWQHFRYEHLHNFCNRCRRVGHRSPACAELQSPPSVDGLLDILVRHRRNPRLLPSATRREEAHPSPATRAERSRFSHIMAGPTVKNPHSSHVLAGPNAPREDSSHTSHFVAGPNAPREDRSHTSHFVAGPTDVDKQPSHVAEGPTATVEGDVIAESHSLPTAASLGLSKSGSLGLSKSGPETSCGPPSPHHLSTLAFGPKLCEPASSPPSSSVHHGHDLGGGFDGVPAVVGVSDRERQLIQHIMGEDSDSHTDFDDDSTFLEDDVIFTTVGKKKKSKGKFPTICLRSAPRDRTNMKRTKISAPSATGKFSLLADLLGGMSPEELDARYGAG